MNEGSDATSAPILRAAYRLGLQHRQLVSSRSGRDNGRVRRRRLQHRLDTVLQRLATSGPDKLVELRNAEWLLDNTHVIREALRQLEVNLPQSFYRSLPHVKIASASLPRILVVIRELLDEAGVPVDLQWLQQGISTYQTVVPLTLGELWALPTMLRAELLERMCSATEAWLREPDVNSDTAGLAADRVAGSIVSLREVAAFDWHKFVEATSLVEQVLGRDPAAAYDRMDFETRDSYRKQIERISRLTGMAETSVAEAAITQAAQRQDRKALVRETHVGFFLVDRGRIELLRQLGYHTSMPWRAMHKLAAAKPILYLFAVIAPSIAASAVLGIALTWSGVGPLLTVPMVFAALIVTTSLSGGLANWLVTNFVAPTRLPKLDFSAGIPSRWRTAVVFPAMLTNPDEVDELIANLEVNYLANSDPALRYVLLTDFADADERETATDRSLLEQARAGIDVLNRRHTQHGQPFFLFHRTRLWNDRDHRWMGWERKRGKLMEFNTWLRQEGDTSFQLTHGNLDLLANVQFVITLDADSRLPSDEAARLVGLLAHPLNRPVFNPETSEITAGYTVVQPRLEVSPASGNHTWFSRIYSGDVSLDLYSHAVSDVYQDLFGTGIFAGKGIYDLDGFSRCLRDHVPENSVLSHDLLEGLLGRAALASDLVMLEDYPPNLSVYLRRLHRWTRGDWQLLPWALGGGYSKDLKNFRPGLIGRWQLLDNLRRSMLSPALVLLLIGAWTVFPGEALWWTLGIAAAPGIPIVLSVLGALRRDLWRWGTVRSSLRYLVQRVGADFGRWLLALVFLPCEAWTNLDAAVRTLYRLAVSRRGLLEWTAAAHVARRLGGKPSTMAVWRDLLAGPAWATIGFALVTLLKPTSLPSAAPLLLLWLFSPMLAERLGRVRYAKPAALDANATQVLRILARQTWRFFEDFVGPDSAWLPPDNVQFVQTQHTAMRTSPTNAGLGLLAIESAYQLGFIGREEYLLRVTNTLDSLDRLATHRGHFYNWYGLDDLRPLEPRYVSTVDSGNLVACFIALLRGLAEACRQKPDLENMRLALTDCLVIIKDKVARVTARPGSESNTLLVDALQAAASVLDDPQWLVRLEDFPRQHCDAIEAALLASLKHDSSAWSAEDIAEIRAWTRRLRGQVRATYREQYPSDFSNDVAALIHRLDRFIDGTNFRFLYDESRHLFHIGYNVTSGELDGSYYDLLASEARIASFVAIGKGDVPVKHWLHLGRPLTRLRSMRVLLSWSATSFEYLMPRLLMRCPDLGLLYQSCRGAVRQQARHGHRHRIPWGISESGYYKFDQQGLYQYQAFGVSALGLKRDQQERLVVSPYASVLALPFEPAAVLENIQALEQIGLRGRYGFFEAIDFGETGAGRQERPRIVRSYMAHHQGMIIAAICNAVCDDRLVELFHDDPRIVGIDYLLYEELPRRAATETVGRLPTILRETPTASAVVETWDVSRGNEVTVLSNGHLSTTISSQGGGSITWNRFSVTRWRPDQQGPYGGSALYFKDLKSGNLWGLGNAPGGEELTAQFGPHVAEFSDHRHRLHIRTQIVVAAQYDVEVRRLTITNETDQVRHLQVTHCGEVLLGDNAADRRHPAFSKLFVESREIAERNTLLSSRRPRRPADLPLHLAHTVVAATDEPVVLHADRYDFLGRRGRWAHPGRLNTTAPLATSDVPRSPLDPVSGISIKLTIPPRAAVQCAFLTAVGVDQQRVLEDLEQFRSLGRVGWTIEQARARSERELSQLKMSSQQVRTAMSLLAKVVWSPDQWAAADVGDVNSVQQSLWRHGISGDRPIVVVTIQEAEDVTIAKEAVESQAYWNNRGVAVDLLLLDRSRSSYLQPTQDRLRRLVQTHAIHATQSQESGSTFIIPASHMDPAETRNIIAAARVLIDASGDSLQQRVREVNRARPTPPAFVPHPSALVERTAIPPIEPPSDLLLNNGIGGFSADGREYVISVGEKATPAPWCNVLANPRFGTLLSESGSACTWFGNSSEYRLTPWRNDPVQDTSGEALYFRDEETGKVWSPCGGPRSHKQTHLVRHGAGYSHFLKNAEGLEQRVTVFVDPVHPLKIIRVRLTNRWQRVRRLTASYAAEWVLGNDRGNHSRLLLPFRDGTSRAIMVRNAFDRTHCSRVAFLASNLDPHGFTCDGHEFLGADRNWDQPPGLWAVGLSDYVGASDCPLAAYQVHVSLEPDETLEFHFVLGAEEDRDTAVDLAQTARDGDWVARRWSALTEHWDQLLGACQVRTPMAGLDAMVNRWLPYQVITARLWARTGYYQSAGGYGFRDQLQDALALLPLAPAMVREQILRAAAVQFEEGDVPHWWHEEPLRGVRTRCSDDLLWLPFVTAAYVKFTGDYDLLETQIPFLASEVLGEDELERYAELERGSTTGSLYDHCCRAIDIRFTVGRHGLPLMGTGDWNDGFDRVGWKGGGESVWLGWFLSVVCQRFSDVSAKRGDTERADHYREMAATLRDNCNATAWTGDWYLRGYYDDGTPLGHPDEEECRIDLNAQTWAAIAGAPKLRVRKALAAAERELADPEHQIIKLLTPAFHRSEKDPGYIKAYPPGVRENGGQYTHASVWGVWALAEIGDAAKATQWLSWLLPFNHALDIDACQRYRVEPYVLAGDVYGEPPYKGRGGWSWYSGAAGWMYQAIITKLLGLTVVDGMLTLNPCLPGEWGDVEIRWRYLDAVYDIQLQGATDASECALFLDGELCQTGVVLADTGHHSVVVRPANTRRDLVGS